MSSLVSIYTITEGPTDVSVIRAVLDHLGLRYTLATLQPEGDGLDGPVASEHGYGWREGVRAYCQSEREVIDVSRALGVVIIQVDTDVAYKNKEDFPRDLVRPCPPARATCDEVRAEIVGWLGGGPLPNGIVLCVPSPSTEAWVVVALAPDTPQKLLKTRLSRETNNEKARLRAIGTWALFECPRRHGRDPETLLRALGLSKDPGAFDRERQRITQGWPNARNLPEARRFEDDLCAALTPP